MTFIPHTPQNIEDMLNSIGVQSIEDLFDEIPKSIPKAKLNHLGQAMNEMELMQYAQALAAKIPQMTCFIGAGSYDHHIPAAIWDIASRAEFLTSYTPYQAEVSQASLQVLYEFQTMIAELYDLDVANASLYDGATALAEAILMAKRIQKNHPGHKVLIPYALHPRHKLVLKTILAQQNIECLEAPFDHQLGTTDLNALKQDPDVFACVITQINFFGQLEPVDELCDFSNTHDQICIAYANPMFLSLLKGPGSWGKIGVDIACGEGQVFGIPMGSGGPYLGLLACKKEHVRQIPGRLIGQTTDTKARQGFSLTLQAREQHIRRAKATSNICTNVGLNVTAATIYMSLMGAAGLKATSIACYQKTHQLAQELCKIPGVRPVFNGEYMHELNIYFPIPAAQICHHLASKNILAGLDLGQFFPERKNELLICVTEKRSQEDIEHYISAIKDCLENQSNIHQGAKHAHI